MNNLEQLKNCLWTAIRKWTVIISSLKHPLKTASSYFFLIWAVCKLYAYWDNLLLITNTQVIWDLWKSLLTLCYDHVLSLSLQHICVHHFDFGVIFLCRFWRTSWCGLRKSWVLGAQLFCKIFCLQCITLFRII